MKPLAVVQLETPRALSVEIGIVFKQLSHAVDAALYQSPEDVFAQQSTEHVAVKTEAVVVGKHRLE